MGWGKVPLCGNKLPTGRGYPGYFIQILTRGSKNPPLRKVQIENHFGGRGRTLTVHILSSRIAITKQ